MTNSTTSVNLTPPASALTTDQAVMFVLALEASRPLHRSGDTLNAYTRKKAQQQNTHKQGDTVQLLLSGSWSNSAKYRL